MSQPQSPWYALYPYGGGGAGSFGPLNAYLGNAHRHVPAYPGRDHRFREASLDRFSALADEAWAQLRSQLVDRPADTLVLFGYSLGAMVAAEMAYRLQEEGSPVRALVVAGAAAPTTWRTHGLSELDDDGYVARLKELGIAPAELLDDPAMRTYLMPIWRADASVAESYPHNSASLRCPVHAIAGNRDPLVDAGDLVAWKALGGHGSTTQLLGGDHGSLIRNPVPLARTLLRAALPVTTLHAGAA